MDFDFSDVRQVFEAADDYAANNTGRWLSVCFASQSGGANSLNLVCACVDAGD